MANLTINQLERFNELAMDYAAAISSGSVTNSATLQQIMDKFLSAQAGNAGKFLTTDGTNASWQAPLPDQTGQNGKFLTTNGTAASWGTVDLSPYEVTANKAQDLTSPSATTYPSTQAVVNESNRIISIMNNSNWLTFPDWSQRTLIFNSGPSGTSGHIGTNGYLSMWDTGQAREMNWILNINGVNAAMNNNDLTGYRNNTGGNMVPVQTGDTWSIIWARYSGSTLQIYFIPCRTS